MAADLEAIRVRWSAAHHDEGLVRSLSADDAYASLLDAIDDVHDLLKIADVVHAAGKAADADDQAFDEAIDRLWAKACELAGKAPRDAVSDRTAPIDGERTFTREVVLSIAQRAAVEIERDPGVLRVVVAVTAPDGAWVGVGSNTSLEDTRAILNSALFGADLKVYGVEIGEAQRLPDTEPSPAGHIRLVFCKLCLKTHSVTADEKPCADGAWISDDPPLAGGSDA